MKIGFENPRHKRLANDFGALSKKYDRRQHGVSDDIIDTLNVLAAADSLADVPRAFRPHPLKAKLKGLFAVDVNRTHRVIFRPDHDDENFRIDQYKTITSIVIIELYKDYH